VAKAFPLMELLSREVTCRPEGNLVEITNGDKGEVEAMVRVWNKDLNFTTPCRRMVTSNLWCSEAPGPSNDLSL
jgi:hypothetical protein